MLINDIRIYGLDQLVDRVTSVNPSLLTLKPQRFHDIATRFTLSLLSQKFDCGPGPVCHLELAFKGQHGVIEPQWIGPCRKYTCGVDRIQFANSDETTRDTFFIDAIFAMLMSISAYDKLEDSVIKQTRDQLAMQGEALEIVKRQQENQKYNVAVLYTVGQPSKFILSGTQKDSLITSKLTVLELDRVDDIFMLAARLNLKSKAIAIYPRTNVIAHQTMQRYLPRLRANGYCLERDDFIEVSLKRLFENADFDS